PRDARATGQPDDAEIEMTHESTAAPGAEGTGQAREGVPGRPTGKGARRGTRAEAADRGGSEERPPARRPGEIHSPDEATGLAASREQLARDVRASLTADPPSLPCKYLYDDRGSELFDAITKLPEYYPTRTEEAILAA